MSDSRAARDCETRSKVVMRSTYAWDDSKTSEYKRKFDRNMKDLQTYSSTSLDSFGKVSRSVVKLNSTTGVIYGEQYDVTEMQKSCDDIQEIVRKAVSWSEDIPTATIHCRCKSPKDIFKLTSSNFNLRR